MPTHNSDLRAPVDDHLPPRLKPRRRSHGKFWLFVILLAFVGFAVWGILSRHEQSQTLEKKTNEAATLVVTVIHPKMLPAANEIVLPGNVRAWHEASLSARVTGYLKSWHKDIGDHVKAGDLLAEIDTPETDAQLRQSQADMQLAIANNNLAQATAQRWLALRKTDSVTQQETDEKVADAAAKAASVQSAQATVDRLRDLKSFKQIIAPFDGVVTNRNTDIGALINENGGELYHLATIDRLRIYINMPENYTTSLTPLMTAAVRFNEHPGKEFDAKLLDTAKAIDPVTRTLLVQFELDNSSGTLYPGGYGEVHIKVPSTETTMRLPVNALIFQGQGLQAAVVGPDNKVALKRVQPGRDFGSELEILSGVTPDDNVIVNPPDSVFDGEVVRLAPPPKPNGGAEQQQAKDEHAGQPSDSDKSQQKQQGEGQQQRDPKKAHSDQQNGQTQ